MSSAIRPGTELISSRLALAVTLSLACWPVLRWYAVRLTDGSDEPWGLLALGAAIWFAPHSGWLQRVSRTRVSITCTALAMYVLSYPWAPPLVHALLFTAGLAGLIAPASRVLPWSLLLVLSLPLIATLQFYAGYPLRVAATALCVPLLRLGGLTVSAQGTTLTWAGECVIVDAPCSGIQMLWTGLVLASALACLQRLSTRSSISLIQRASAIVFAANVLRATVLFCTETRLWPAPQGAHEIIGLIMFAFAAGLILKAAPQPSKPLVA